MVSSQPIQDCDTYSGVVSHEISFQVAFVVYLRGVENCAGL